MLTVFSVAAQTKVVKTSNGFELQRNGKPYYIKGVGGDVNMEKIVAIGANSVRTWGVERAQEVLDEAQRNGLTVMLGLWVQHERHGFDYNNQEKVAKQLAYFKTVIDRFKNHPALLIWGVGNEVDLNYTNPNVWNAIQDIAKYIHDTDPNHPTTTVTAGLDSLEVAFITARCPDIDIYSINTYGDIGNVPNHIAKFGWNGPYMITEWGPNGHWESPQTKWGVSIEQNSTEKKEVYFNRYKNYIEKNSNTCLGSYAFLWGAKQEYTETWYGLFSKNNIPTEPIDALEEVFTGKALTKPAPTISVSKDLLIFKESGVVPLMIRCITPLGILTSIPVTRGIGNSLSYWNLQSESSNTSIVLSSLSACHLYKCSGNSGLKCLITVFSLMTSSVKGKV